jgi:hypothetical protein
MNGDLKVVNLPEEPSLELVTNLLGLLSDYISREELNLHVEDVHTLFYGLNQENCALPVPLDILFPLSKQRPAHFVAMASI